MRLTLASLTALLALAAPAAASSEGVIAKVFRANQRKARCIARYESSFQADAVHHNGDGSIDRGLFQINSVHIGTRVSFFSRTQHRGVSIVVRASRLFNAYYNARVAWALSKGGHDFGPWTTRGYC